MSDHINNQNKEEREQTIGGGPRKERWRTLKATVILVLMAVGITIVLLFYNACFGFETGLPYIVIHSYEDLLRKKTNDEMIVPDLSRYEFSEVGGRIDNGSDRKQVGLQPGYTLYGYEPKVDSIESSLYEISVYCSDPEYYGANHLSPPFEYVYKDTAIKAYDIEAMEIEGETYSAHYKCPIGSIKYHLFFSTELQNYLYSVSGELIITPENIDNDAYVERRIDKAQEELMGLVEDIIDRWYEKGTTRKPDIERS